MRLKWLLIILIFNPAWGFTADAQGGLHTSSGKAVKAYNTGIDAYEYLDYPKAEVFFKEALKYDSWFFEAYMMLGELYTKQKKFSEATYNYTKALAIDSTAYKPAWFSLADAQFNTGDYENAIINYSKYLRNKSISEINKQTALRNIRNCEFALLAVKNPLEFNPVNIGPGINSRDDEYWPSITADGLTLMFTRQFTTSTAHAFGSNPAHEDFFISRTQNGKDWETAINAGAPLNTSQNEGAQTLSSAGNYMYFTACERMGGVGSCDIYFSSFSGGKWTSPVNLGQPVNTRYWESTPSINANGNLLVFSSNRPGGFGGKDLWYSTLLDNGKWSTPKNLGENVNTNFDEMSPFLHFDGRTLYFASDGRPGMGGLDIFLTSMKEDSVWTEPRNIGYPINTFSDETGLVIDATGSRAYFSSKREPATGKDIYYFELDKNIRPNPVSYLKGKVVDRETGALLRADYMLINLSTNKVSVKNTTDDQGNFLVCLPSGQNYGVNIFKEGYLFYSESFMLEGEYPVSKPMAKQIALSRIKVGERLLLANVFYEIDSWALKDESLRELNTLYELLRINSGVKVEIGGYTDSTGSDQHNMVLSERRANSVVSYLVERGIDPGRLTARGYGNSSPVGDNVSAEGRRLNRRTEVKIIGLGTSTDKK